MFERKTALLKSRVKGSVIADRAKWLTKTRDSEGYMAQFVAGGKDESAHILECHSPIMNLLDCYPIIGRLEEEMFQAVLGTRVRREESRNSGLFECAFYFAA
jgi:predicted ArsR family transcriptional regulator